MDSEAGGVSITLPEISYDFENVGNTPAFVTDGATRFINANLRELPSEPDYGARQRPTEVFTVAGAAQADRKPLEAMLAEVDDDQVEVTLSLTSVRRGTTNLIVYGFFVYRDIFDDRETPQRPHEIRFCLVYKIQQRMRFANQPVTWWEQCGPPAYNRYT